MIHDDCMKMKSSELLEGVTAAGCGMNAVAESFEHGTATIQFVLLIVDIENGFADILADLHTANTNLAFASGTGFSDPYNFKSSLIVPVLDTEDRTRSNGVRETLQTCSQRRDIERLDLLHKHVPIAVHTPHQGGQTQGGPFLIPMGHFRNRKARPVTASNYGRNDAERAVGQR